MQFDKKGSTLQDSADRPGQVAYLILFWDANPRWDTDGIIFTKSRLELLPTSPTDHDDGQANSGAAVGTENVNGEAQTNGRPGVQDGGQESKPIAVCKQVSSSRATRGYKLGGWFKIERIAYLEPHSSELVRMLEQKWSKKDRSGATFVQERSSSLWNESLGYRWAVVKLSRDEVAEKELDPPKIERLSDGPAGSPRAPRKSVNEMLAEMRLKEVKPDIGPNANSDGAGDVAFTEG